MQLIRSFADVNGTRLYYELAGAGQALILIHGFTLDTRMWDDQFEAFARHYQVLRYDARGFGQSALPTADTYAHHDDLRALLTYLSIDHAHVVGLSMGGGIAIDFAVTYPECTDTLIPVDALLPGYQWRGERASATARVAGERQGVEAAKAVWLACDLFVPAAENPRVAASLQQIVNDYSGWHFVNNDPVRIPQTPAIDKIDTLAMPVLAVLGERDVPDFHHMADIMAERIADATKVVLPGVGHMSNMEAPERFNETVLDFLAVVS